MAKVMIHPATYDNVAEAVDWAFELFTLAVKGKTVLIKPNVLRASEAREASSPTRQCFVQCSKK